MHSINNIANRIFVVVFVLLLWVPIMHINRAEKSESENRMLAVMPGFMADGKINNKFGEEFNAWFNDRFFGRDALIRTHNNVINAIQGNKSTGGGNARVLIGADNWLFYKGENSLKNYTNSNTPSAERMAAILTYLKDIDAWCKKHNKKFYYVIGPDKNKIYPEFFPTYVKKVKPDTDGVGMTFYRYIRDNSDINVIYPYDDLIAAKDGDLLYYKNDTHWNMRGGHVAFRALYKEIFNAEFDEKKFIRAWHESEPYTGDLLNMLNLSDGSKYAQERYKIPEFYKDIECTPTEMYSNANGMIKCKNPNGGLRAYVFRDSFFNALTPYLSQVFNITELHWKNNVEKSDLDKIATDYDIVIMENVERITPALSKQKFPKD